jgi:hypothetical protein
MARGALRGAMSAWLGLIVLQVATTQGGSSKVGGVLDVVNSAVKRALDPNVAAIPDRSTGTAAASSRSRTPAQAGISAKELQTGADNAALILGGQWPTNIPVPSQQTLDVLSHIDWTQLANNPALHPTP